MIKNEHLIKENIETSRRLCKQNEDEEDIMEVADIDFFKTTFWGEPIPSRIVDRVISANA